MSAFKDISVFVTGCNRGIGLAIVKHLVNLPISPKRIFATCRSVKAESARELNELATKHKQLHVLELDVTNALQLVEVVKQVESEVGNDGLNLLINNAGIYDTKNSPYAVASSTLDDVTAELMLKVFETNTVAPLMIAKAFLPLLKQATLNTSSPARQPMATIVNMSSDDASIQLNGGGLDEVSCGGHYQYKSSKAALNMVTKSLSVDLAKNGISVVSIDPGWNKTDMGGPYAPLTLSETIPLLVKTIGSLDQHCSGSFLQYNGKTLPW